MKKKLILITGSSGFIGNLYLRHSLKKGYKILDLLRKKHKKNKDLNFLRKKYKKNYKSIFYSNLSEINKKLKQKKVDYFINFATLYKNDHKHNDIPSFIESNILFPSIVLDSINKGLKKIINFGTMMQHIDGKNYLPKNFYASTKSAFEMILKFYSINNKKIKLYNLKFYESFSENDKRKKLIPTLINNYKKKITTRIISNKLELNIIHTEDIIKAIDILLAKNLKTGNYCLKQTKNTKINELISKINKGQKRCLNVKYLSNKVIKPKSNKLQILPYWKPREKIDIKIIKKFIYETN